MGDSGDEIEYLDEDADIVQQCVVTPNLEVPFLSRPAVKSPLLVERKRRTATFSHISSQKRKKDVDDDEDYDPTKDEDFRVKKKSFPVVHRKSQLLNRTKTPVVSAFSTIPLEIDRQKFVSTPNEYAAVKQKLQAKAILKPDKLSDEIVCIYDYRDPLCVRDKPYTGDEEEMGHIKDWNRLCYEQFLKREKRLVPEDSEFSTTKSLIFRNVCNSLTGKEVPTVWSRLVMRNQDGKKRSEGFESILPNFTTAKVDFEMSTPTTRNQKNHVLSSNCVLLTKEEHKDGEVLVAYKPQDAVAFIFEVKEEKIQEQGRMSKVRYLEEKLLCQICTMCYQYSWRGPQQEKIGKKQIKCTICSRGFVNTYNFLLHLKVHSADEVKQNKKAICRTLAETVGYHYKCRICQTDTTTIKELRAHMSMHKGSKQFLCEVGDHITT